MHSEFFRPPAYFFGQLFCTLSQVIPESLPVGDMLDDFQHYLAITELQFHPVRIIFLNQTLLKTFHGKGDNASRRDRVQAAPVAHIRQFDDGI